LLLLALGLLALSLVAGIAIVVHGLSGATGANDEEKREAASKDRKTVEAGLMKDMEAKAAQEKREADYLKWMRQGDAALAAKKHSDALVAYDQALKIKPGDAVASKGKETASAALKVEEKSPKTISNSIGMKLVLIPAGKFLMGSPKAEQDAALNERSLSAETRKLWEPLIRAEGPQHEVEITKPFYLGACEVTQKQYREVMGYNPSYFSKDGHGKDRVKGLDTDDFPVESVSWAHVQVFLKKLAALPKEKEAGREYRLPTEAEWEYAARAGSSAPFNADFRGGPHLPK
jgi:formylglycine-generating enzyme required for sulfatase activity